MSFTALSSLSNPGYLFYVKNMGMSGSDSNKDLESGINYESDEQGGVEYRAKGVGEDKDRCGRGEAEENLK